MVFCILCLGVFLRNGLYILRGKVTCTLPEVIYDSALPPMKWRKIFWVSHLFEATKLGSQHAIEGVGDHGHQEVKVNLRQNGGRRGVEFKNLTTSEMH